MWYYYVARTHEEGRDGSCWHRLDPDTDTQDIPGLGDLVTSLVIHVVGARTAEVEEAAAWTLIAANLPHVKKFFVSEKYISFRGLKVRQLCDLYKY